MTDVIDDDIKVEVYAHHSEPWPTSYFVEVYDNGMLVKEVMLLLPTRAWAGFRAKQILKRYRKNRFKVVKPESWTIR